MNNSREQSQDGRRPVWIGYVVVVVAELVLTVGLRLLLPVFPLAEFPVPHVLVILLAAYLYGEGPAIAAFFMGFLLYVYAFPPYHGIWPLAVRARDWAGIIELLLGSGIVVWATVAMRRRRDHAQALSNELERANRHAEETLESIAECFFALDSQLRIVDLNRVAEETVFGRSRGELIGKAVVEVFPEVDGSEFQRRCQHALSAGDHAYFEDQLWLPGRWFECYMFPYHTCVEVYIRDVTDRKQAEEELRQSEARYRSLIETMNEGFTAGDADYRLTYVNLRFAEMLGFSQAELVGRTVHELLDEESRELFEGQIPQRKAGRYAPYELTWVARDGTKVFTLVSPRPVFDQDGAFAGAFAAITDITEVKRSAEALRDSERRYRELFHKANDAIFLVDAPDQSTPGRFIDVNDVACQRLGYTRDELLRMGPADVDSPEAAESTPEIMKQIRKEGHVTFEVVQLTKDGRRIPVEISAHLFHMDRGQVILAIARDITERKLAEDRLGKSEERFRNLFERAADCLFLHDLQGRFVEVNQMACETLGYTREELLGMAVSDIVTDYDRAALERTWDRLLISPITVEAVHRRKDGSTMQVEGRLSIIEYRGQTHVLAVVRDVTERKQAEEERRAMEQHMEEQKRLFYRETIFSVTNGKLDICDERDIAPYLANCGVKMEVNASRQASRARHGVEEFCRAQGLEGDRLDLFMVGVGEGITNAVKHGNRGSVCAGVTSETVWVAIEDNGPGIESLILPRAVLLRGFSTKPSLGLGYCVMLDVADRIHLKTDEHGTVVILEKRLAEDSGQPSLQDLPDTWAGVRVEDVQ